jgi:hypothetical protein
LDEENKQFAQGLQNVLLIVPNSDNPLFGGRDELIRAFFGEDTYVITFDRQTGEAVKEEWKFSPKGKFLRLWNDGKPRFTRTSAVLLLKGHVRVSDGQIDVSCFVLHNPFASASVPADIWGDFPQFIVDGNVMRWTDGTAPWG